MDDKLVSVVLELWKLDAQIQMIEVAESGHITVCFFDRGGNFHQVLHNPDQTVTTIQ